MKRAPDGRLSGVSLEICQISFAKPCFLIVCAGLVTRPDVSEANFSIYITAESSIGPYFPRRGRPPRPRPGNPPFGCAVRRSSDLIMTGGQWLISRDVRRARWSGRCLVMARHVIGAEGPERALRDQVAMLGKWTAAGERGPMSHPEPVRDFKPGMLDPATFDATVGASIR
jgi:hypothetical protein